MGAIIFLLCGNRGTIVFIHNVFFLFVLSGLCVIHSLAAQNMVHGPAAWYPPRSLLEMRTLRLDTPNLLNQTLRFNKTLGHLYA